MHSHERRNNGADRRPRNYPRGIFISNHLSLDTIPNLIQILALPDFKQRSVLLKRADAGPLGLQLRVANGRATVSSIDPQSPAAVSDLVFPGDVVTTVNRSATFDATKLPDVVDKADQIILSLARPEVSVYHPM